MGLVRSESPDEQQLGPGNVQSDYTHPEMGRKEAIPKKSRAEVAYIAYIAASVIYYHLIIVTYPAPHLV